MPEFLTRGPTDSRVHLLLAHGAGAPMSSPFLEALSDALTARRIANSRFDFGYMSARTLDGTRRPPPKAELLMGEYEAAADALKANLQRGQRLVIGGKSMGGRVASMIADRLHGEGRIAGLVVAGYPFHPPGKPFQLRTAHLASLACPTLIVQGERDPFGTRAEVEGYRLADAIRCHWIARGDHDWRPERGTGASRKSNLAAAADAIAGFCQSLGTTR